MTRDVQRDALEAKLLLDNEFLKHFLASAIDDALSRVMYAAPADHDGRQAAAAEARAIQSFRQALQLTADAGGASRRPRRGTPA